MPDEDIWPPPPERQSVPPKASGTWWQELFVVPDGPAEYADVVQWWEARRWTYNKLVFGFGIPSSILYLVFLVAAGGVAYGEDAVEPMALFIAPVVVPIVVNVCYTLGRIVENIWRFISRDRTRAAGRVLMMLGVGFSAFVVFAPTVLWGIALFYHLLKR